MFRIGLRTDSNSVWHVVGTPTKTVRESAGHSTSRRRELTLQCCEVPGDVGVTEDLVTALPVVGRGIDPRTSRFSGRMYTDACCSQRTCWSRRTPSPRPTSGREMELSGSLSFALLRVGVGTRWARSLTKVK